MMSRGGPPDNEKDGGGYRQPPRATRFTKGQSGNSAGRPRGRHREAPYEAVLGQMVTIREGGVERRVTATEAFLLQHSKRALEGDGAATRTTLAVIEYANLGIGVSDGWGSDGDTSSDNRCNNDLIHQGSRGYAYARLTGGREIVTPLYVDLVDHDRAH
jgi:hypothetical protein